MNICLPLAQGVPGFSNQPPYWLPGHPTFPENKELDDPRWRGAYRRSLNDDVVFRALYHVEAGAKSLYLSWRAVFVPKLDDANDLLYVGLRAEGGTTAMVIQIQVHDAPVAHKADPVQSIQVFTRTGGGAWTSVAADPAWINTNTRMWVEPGAGVTGSYTVQMRVPIAAAGSITGDAGPTLGDRFDFWYLLQGGDPVNDIILLGESPALGTTGLALLTNNYPDPAGWDRVSTVPGDPACPTTGGVALSSVDVGTTNAVASQIQFNGAVPVPSRPVNTFVARPRNHTGAAIPAGGISARFRIANWGSIAAPTNWVNIPGGGGVASSAVIPDLPPGNPPPATNPISFTWRLDDTDIATFITGTTPHKCILVELDGPNLTFFNESVYRNMDFVTASRFVREAEISVVGLGNVSTGRPFRDLFLAIEKYNMPASVKPGSDQPPGTDRPRAGGNMTHGHPGALREHLALAKRGQLDEEEIQTFMPTYRVRVYHDTGERIDRGGQQVRVLRPQTYFGYFLEHEGQLVGWRDRLQAPPATQLRELTADFYQIAVPNEGVAKVTTTVLAAETAQELERFENETRPKGCLASLFELFRNLLGGARP